MKKQNTKRNKQPIDRSYTSQSVCQECQNRMSCQFIASAMTSLSSENVILISSPIALKKFATITDHLRREGFSFPYVSHPSQCWMHQKFGVATFYENQLIQLAEKMNHDGPMPEQPDAFFNTVRP